MVAEQPIFTFNRRFYQSELQKVRVPKLDLIFSDNTTDQWFVVNKDKLELQEGNYSTYAKCVNVICGDPGEVAVFNSSASNEERKSGRAWTCEPIGKPSPRCSANGVVLVNYFGEGTLRAEELMDSKMRYTKSTDF